MSKLGEIIDLGVKAGVIEKSGAWFSWNSTRIGQGRDNAREFLKANPDIAEYRGILASLHNDVGSALLKQNRPGAALVELQRALRMRKPFFFKASCTSQSFA